MRKFLIGLAALAAAIFALIALAPALIPAAAYKSRLEAAASNALGRDVSVGDDISLRLAPSIGFRVADLRIANPDGFSGPAFMTVGTADVGVDAVSLLRGEVAISRFILREPVIALERAADGRENWTLGTTGEPSAPGDGDGGAPGPRALRLGDVRIVDGSATYQDIGTGQRFVAENIDLSIALASLDAPLVVEGAFIFQSAPASVALVLAEPRAVLEKGVSTLKVDAKIAGAALGADLALAGGVDSYRGPVRIDAPDLKKLSSLFGVDLKAAPGFDRLRLLGDIEGGAGGATFRIDDLEFDAIKAKGTLKLALNGPRPKLSGELAASAVDLRPYIPASEPTGPGFPAWSNESFDFSSLANVDADIAIAADAIQMGAVAFGDARMHVVIDRARMKATVTQLAAYDGAGAAELVVNARGRTPSMSGFISLRGLDAALLGADILKNDRLTGRGAAEATFSASGNSQAALMRTLDGAGSFDFEDGAIRGLNIAKVARSVGVLKSGFTAEALSGAIAAAQAPDEKTDFSRFLSRFSIEDGVATVSAVQLEAPFLSMTGAGVVDLAAQSVDIRLRPRVSQSAAGDEAGAITAPLRVTGSFSAPKVTPDIEAAAKERVRDGVKGLLDEALGSRGAKDGAASAGDGSRDGAKSILRAVVGRDQPAPQAETPAGGAPAPDEGSGSGGEANKEADPAAALADKAVDLIFGSSRPEPEAAAAGDTADAAGENKPEDKQRP